MGMMARVAPSEAVRYPAAGSQSERRVIIL